MSPHDQVRRFNAEIGWGDPVILRRNGRDNVANTRSPAQVLSDGRAVVWLDGIVGAVSVEKVRPIGKDVIGRKLTKN